MFRWRQILVALAMLAPALAGADRLCLGVGTNEFVSESFADRTILIEGRRFVHLESTWVRFVDCSFSNVLIRADEAVLQFHNCAFVDTPETVILATACHATVTDCSFERTAEAINLIRSTGEISGSSFRQIRLGADAIDIDFDPLVPGWSPVRVVGNVIDQCSGDGIDLGACQSAVLSNQVFNCADKGISIGEGSSGNIRGNLVQHARIGIAIKDGANPRVDENTITHCRFGIRSYEKTNGSGGAYGECRSNRFFACVESFSSDHRSLPFESDRVDLSSFPNVVPLYTNAPRIVINEVGHVMPTGVHEFVELFNPTEEAVDLTGWSIVDDVFHAFAPGTILPGGGYHVVRFPRDSLGDDVLVLRLVDEHQTDVDTVEIFPYRGWPIGNGGHPLELLDPLADNNDGRNWENSVFRGGSPNVPNSRTQRVVEPVNLVPVSITEIMYHPPDDAEVPGDTNEYIEITNHSPIDIDLTGWAFTDGIRHILPFGKILVPGERFVVRPPFQHGRLSNRGERIDLRDAIGQLVDRVEYLDRGEWPRQADGEGAALELVSLSLDNNQPRAWRAALPGSPGEPNVVTNDADVAIYALAHRPVQPTAVDPIEIHLKTDGMPRLQWRLDPGSTWINKACVRLESNRWAAVLPPQAEGALVAYRVVANDAEGRERVSQPQLVRVSSRDSRTDVAIWLDAETLDDLLRRPLQSDLLLPCSFVVGRQIFHRARLRYRGLTKRAWPTKSYRIDLRDDHPFETEDRLNLNGKRPVSERLAYEVFHRFGFRTPTTRLVSARLGSGPVLPLALTERQYPDPASEGWPAVFDSTALPEEERIDVPNWIDWFALTAVLGDAQTLLNDVDGNHALEGWREGAEGPLRLQPLDLDIAFASQPPRSSPSITNSRLHPGMLESTAALFLSTPLFRQAYYDRVLAIMDEVLVSADFAAAADVLFAAHPVSFQDSRGLVQNYLTRDLPAIEAEIQALISDWSPQTASSVHVPYPDSWFCGTIEVLGTVFVDDAPIGVFTNVGEWCADVSLVTATQRVSLSMQPLSRREWRTEARSVDVIYDPAGLDTRGLPLSWRLHFDLSDPDGDPDGDGLDNREEFEGRTHPLLDSRLRVTLERRATGGLELRWPSDDPGSLQGALDEDWVDWGELRSVSGGRVDLDTSSPRQVFRIQFPVGTGVRSLQKPSP